MRSERPKMMPADTPDYMASAWFDALHWAIGEADVLKRFGADTNIHWQPGETPIDLMLDKITGLDREFIEAFIQWFNVNVWGPINTATE